MSEKVKGYIKKLFEKINKEVNDIVRTVPSFNVATHSIMEYISITIAESFQGYMADLYGELSKKTLSEEIFQNAVNANKFYELKMSQKIYDAYDFDVQDLNTYRTGIDFKEINRIYTTAGVAVGSTAVGGILLGVLYGIVDIPIVVIIAGAILGGIIGSGSTYMFIKGIPEKNRTNFTKVVNAFMDELEKELLNWVDEVVKFYNQKVEELKATLIKGEP